MKVPFFCKLLNLWQTATCRSRKIKIFRCGRISIWEIGHNANFVHGRNHDLLRTEPIRDVDLEIRPTHDHDHKLATSRTHTDDVTLSHDNVHNFFENGFDMDQIDYPGAEEDHAGVEKHDDQLADVVEHHEFGLHDGTELTLVKNQHL
ncbi:hypothetical protein F3Y22_tig00111099pilonHSYRG00263 [Hibiscus syriacus]|uniref:Uncharacterized protein n=1 Tax=Hibiscus syriacus TaxID=106335 RepID=A0A6A2Z1R3_HIBSY|nr:hypothetical protein F3Y22_tig00111099pilonHSYRG00263 [Hibiscus syriacus]